MATKPRYILLENRSGERLDGTRTPWPLAAGRILECSSESRQPEDSEKIALRVIPTRVNITLVYHKRYVGPLTDSEADLLVAVRSPEETLRIYQNKNLLTAAKTFNIGSKVFVKIRKHNTDLELRGVIRYKGNFQIPGSLYDVTGTKFGVELLDKESEGCGDTDGTYRKTRYFTCPTGRGIFVAVHQLHPRQDQDQDEQRKIHEEVERRLHSSEQRSHELELSLAVERQAREETERRLRSNEQRLEETERRLRSNEQRSNALETSLTAETQAHQETERRLRSNEQRLEDTERCLRSNEQSLDEERQAHQETERRLRSNEQRLDEERQAHQETASRLQSSEERLHELEGTLTTVRQAYEDYRRSIESTRDWIVRRDDIILSDNVIGVGAWGEVKEGTFRGCKVAVKKIHQLILSHHNRRLFEREMNMASRCRHPCLLQFIGATNDDQSPLFVTELLDTSLRVVLQDDQPLEPPEITTIALDVAKALNYLHLSHPAPIIHRDISNANVLLWKHVTIWRAKVSDYGTAKFLQQSMTVCPGAFAYSAPEAQTSRQSPKLDVYSFGVLLCEMNVREIPDPDHRNEQVAMVTNNLFRNLIRRCLKQNPEERPSMAEIIETLENTPRSINHDFMQAIGWLCWKCITAVHRENPTSQPMNSAI